MWYPAQVDIEVSRVTVSGPSATLSSMTTSGMRITHAGLQDDRGVNGLKVLSWESRSIHSQFQRIGDRGERSDDGEAWLIAPFHHDGIAEKDRGARCLLMPRCWRCLKKAAALEKTAPSKAVSPASAMAILMW